MSDLQTYRTLSLSRPGAKRDWIEQKENEDRVLVRTFSSRETFQDEPVTIVAVADGVSRCAAGGAVAEWLLLERVGKDAIFTLGEPDLEKQFLKYLRTVHSEFLERFGSQRHILESGCTFCAAFVQGTKASAFWAGDSPVHHLRKNGGKLHARTLTIQDKDRFSGALTDCFSGVTAFNVKKASVYGGLRPGDVMIAASDGLAFDGEALAATIDQVGFTEEWMEELYERSYARPYSDDISLAAIRLEEE